VSRVRFLPAAYHDIRAAYDWYESQRDGLGDDFLAAVKAATVIVRRFPEAQLVAHRDTRRYLLERFPFCLFYREDRGELLVIACLHAARDPELRDLRLDD
jgi:plasmid stabilization system protein ParE